MALILKMKGGGQHFLTGDKVPWWWCYFPFRFWFPRDFFGVEVAVRFSDIQSLTPVDDNEVRELVKRLQAQSSKVIV